MDSLRTYARDMPDKWIDHLTSLQQERAQQAAHVGRFRIETREGVTVHVVWWGANGELPRKFERVIKHGSAYVLADDVDLCQELEYDPGERRFIDTYRSGGWISTSPRELFPVKAGGYLLYRRHHTVNNLPGLDELLALATDPVSGGTSAYLLAPSDLPPPAPAPRPPPRPRPTFGTVAVHHQDYPWIRTGSANLPLSLLPTPDQSQATPPMDPLAIPASSGAMSWPGDYSVADVSNGLQLIKDSPRGVRGTGAGGVPDHFKRIFPDATYKSSIYYEARKLWRFYASKKAGPARKKYFDQLVAQGPGAQWRSLMRHAQSVVVADVDSD